MVVIYLTFIVIYYLHDTGRPWLLVLVQCENYLTCLKGNELELTLF
jgi:hypothetical protein